MRYFLIDKVTELIPGERIRGVKNVTLADEILHDHFPDYPVLPGALIIEAAAQLSGCLLEATINQPVTAPLRALLVQIEKAKFHDTAGPGDQLEIAVDLATSVDTAVQVTAEVRCGERKICSAGLTFVMKEIDSERLHAQRRYLYQLWTRDLNLSTPIL